MSPQIARVIVVIGHGDILTQARAKPAEQARHLNGIPSNVNLLSNFILARTRKCFCEATVLPNLQGEMRDYRA